MRKTTLAFLFILACASSLMLFAQAPPNPKPPDPAARAQHRVTFLTTLLSLTAAQQQQATTIFTNAATSQSGLENEMRTAHQNLQTATRGNDAAAIEQAAASIGNLTAQRVAAEAKAHAAFYQILTPDQQNKFNQFETEGGGRFGRGMGPGMFGPGPH